MPQSRTGAAEPPPPDHLRPLLLATGGGDVLAFADLYQALSPRVHGLVLRVLGDAHQSEEVTQEVFVQIWQSAGSYDPTRGTPLAWVMTLAHRRAVDRVRSSSSARRRDTEHAEHAGHSVGTPFDATAAAAHASLEARTVREAVAALSPGQRQALELAYFGGHTYQEVSRLLGIPLGTAKGRIRDGLLRLRVLLSPLILESA